MTNGENCVMLQKEEKIGDINPERREAIMTIYFSDRTKMNNCLVAQQMDNMLSFGFMCSYKMRKRRINCLI